MNCTSAIRLAVVMVIAMVFTADTASARGATQLSDPDAVSDYEATGSGDAHQDDASSSWGDEGTSSSSHARSGEAKTNKLGRLFRDPPPEGWTAPRVLAEVEVGWHDWDISSRSGGGDGPGAGFSGDYQIDPVETLRLGGAARWENWSAHLGYLGSLDSAERAELVMGGLTFIRPGKGAWWALSAESGRLQGVASSTDFSGQHVAADIDTKWETVTLEWCRWTGVGLGLVYEDLEQGIRGIAGQADYDVDLDDTLMTLGVEGRLGLTYTREAKTLPLQVFVGVRGRAAAWENGGTEGGRAEELSLSANLRVATIGAFARVTALW